MRQESSTTCVSLRARKTRLRQRHPREDRALVQSTDTGYLAEVVIADVELRVAQAVLADPQHIQTMDATIGLDAHVSKGSIAEVVGAAATAEDDSGHLPEDFHAHIHRLLRPPLVEDRNQVISNRRGPVTAPDGINRLVRVIREEIIDVSALELDEVAMKRERIHTGLNDGQDAEWDLGLMQKLKAAPNGLITPPPAVSYALPVVNLPRTIHADAHIDMMLEEDIDP